MNLPLNDSGETNLFQLVEPAILGILGQKKIWEKKFDSEMKKIKYKKKNNKIYGFDFLIFIVIDYFLLIYPEIFIDRY